MKQGIDYTGVAIVFLCHDGGGNFLMQKRGKNCRDEHDKWDIGAGGLDFDFPVEDILRKEIKEEYCTDVLDYEFLGFRDVHRENNESKTHWIALDFKVLIDRDKVANGEPNKFDKVEWFTFASIPENCHSQFPKFLETYRNKESVEKLHIVSFLRRQESQFYLILAT